MEKDFEAIKTYVKEYHQIELKDEDLQKERLKILIDITLKKLPNQRLSLNIEDDTTTSTKKQNSETTTRSFTEIIELYNSYILNKTMMDWL
ncbi:hypothetical protein [Lacinutrix undariae]